MQHYKRWSILGLISLIMAAAGGYAWWPVADMRKRPQVPALPVPYKVEQVGFLNSNNAGRMSGTLTIPPGSGAHPAIILIPASGEVDRDGTLFEHQFYLVLADHLTRQGFAVLRSDKRGIGQSSGDFAAATSLDFASDIEAGLGYLRRRPDIDAARIGLVGHSEGGLVGAIVASRDRNVAFLVLMATNGIPAGDMLLSRIRHQMPGHDAPGKLEQELALQKAVFAALGAAGTGKESEAAVRRLYADAKARYGRPFSEDEIAAVLSPWMRTLLRIDPESMLGQVRCPVLALVAEKDQVVRPEENMPVLQRALAANSNAEVRLLSGLNHFFQTADKGVFSEVAAIDETMSPDALEAIGSWTVQQVTDKKTSAVFPAAPGGTGLCRPPDGRSAGAFLDARPFSQYNDCAIERLYRRRGPWGRHTPV